MPFGLGKSEKRPENEGETVREEAPKDSESTPPVAAEDGGGPSVPDSPATGGEGEVVNFHRPKAYQPAFLGEATPRAGPPAPAAPAPEGDAFFVSVTRQDTAEAHHFDNPAEAQAFVETLLEQGVSEEEVTAFSGHKLALKVSRRPIVKLTTAQEG